MNQHHQVAVIGHGRLDRLAHWLSKVSLWWVLAGVALFAAFTATVLPWQASLSAAYTHGFRAPDSSFWYTADDLYASAEAWEADGRAAYVIARVTFDVVWPLVYGVFLTASLGWLLGRCTQTGSRWRRLALLPGLAVLLDYAENLCTATVMARYPARTPVLAELAPVFTAAKWMLLSGCFVLLLAALVAAGVSGFRSRRRSDDAPDD